MTFIIREDCYEDNSNQILTTFGEFTNKEELIEHMTRTIIENGGKVIPASTGGKCHYIVTEDGFVNNIWEQMFAGQAIDKHNRKIIHFRWIMQCVSKG